jgi:cytochrome bd-type quinol oxidase subunit 1
MIFWRSWPGGCDERREETMNVVFTLIGFVGLYFVLGLLFLVLVGREISHGPTDALPTEYEKEAAV